MKLRELRQLYYKRFFVFKDGLFVYSYNFAKSKGWVKQ